MNKTEFSQALRRALGKLPSYEVEQSIAFYEEMIADRMEDGMREEEAVEALGPVEAIAAQIIAETPPIPKAIAKANTGSRTLNVVLLVVFSPLWVPVVLVLALAVFMVYLSIWMVIVALWTAVAVQHGVFDFTGELPAGVRDYLPPAAWTVFAARFGGMLSAAGAAAELLKQQLLSTPQLVLVLLAGNIINGVIRTLRRGIPVSLGIYPGADGMLIATISTALRAWMTLIALGITMVVIHYES